MVATQRFTSLRRGLFLAAVCVTALGLAVHFLVPGDLGPLFADALYTVLVYLLLALLSPKTARYLVAVAAFAISALIELAQLTGLPAQLAVIFPPSRLVFGTTFSAPDLLAYAVGALMVWAVDSGILRRRQQLRAAHLE